MKIIIKRGESAEFVPGDEEVEWAQREGWGKEERLGMEGTGSGTGTGTGLGIGLGMGLGSEKWWKASMAALFCASLAFRVGEEERNGVSFTVTVDEKRGLWLGPSLVVWYSGKLHDLLWHSSCNFVLYIVADVVSTSSEEWRETQREREREGVKEKCSLRVRERIGEFYTQWDAIDLPSSFITTPDK